MTHTPGPWGLCESSDARQKGYIRPIGPDAMRADGSRPAVCRIVSEGHTAEERRANTRLIEAAPDLLAAVKLFLENCRTRHPVGFDIRNAEAVFKAMHVAVKKAGE